jgi:hypothetical protein
MAAPEPHEPMRRERFEDEVSRLQRDPVIEAIALRVVALLREHGAPRAQPNLVGATAIAAMFGVSRTWVYENSQLLGASRLGAGPRARLRFDPQHVAGVLRRLGRPEAAPKESNRRRSRWIDEDDLIPITH